MRSAVENPENGSRDAGVGAARISESDKHSSRAAREARRSAFPGEGLGLFPYTDGGPRKTEALRRGVVENPDKPVERGGTFTAGISSAMTPGEVRFKPRAWRMDRALRACDRRLQHGRLRP